MKKLLFLIIVSLVLAGSASARLEWTPGILDPNLVLAVGNWNVAANWTAFSPTPAAAVPTTVDEVRINIDYVPCLIDSDTDAVCLQVKAGDNGDLVGGVAVLTIEGSLTTYTTDSWSSSGYNRPCIINVEPGAFFDNGYRVGVGLVASTVPAVASVLNINAGTVYVGQNLQLGTTGQPAAGHKGQVNVNSGLLDVDGNLQFRGLDCGFIDITFGTVIYSGNVTVGSGNVVTPIADVIASNNITAFGGAGTVVYSSDGSEITITATGDPLARYPDNNLWLASGADIPGSWINLDSIPSGGDVWVEVLLGSAVDNLASLGAPVKNKAAQALPNTVPGVYHWQINTYRHGDPAHDLYIDGYYDPNVDGVPVDQGPIMTYTSSNDIAPANLLFTSTPKVTWIGQEVTVTATVEDDGVSPLDVDWTTDENDPNYTITNETVTGPVLGVYTISADVTINYHSGPFTVSVTVGDTVNVAAVSGTLPGFDCAMHECQATGVAGIFALYPADVVRDCMHDNIDFHAIGAKWLTDYLVAVPANIP